MMFQYMFNIFKDTNNYFVYVYKMITMTNDQTFIAENFVLKLYMKLEKVIIVSIIKSKN